jgi:flagellar biosynthesis chaperone FliJ
MKQFTWRLQRVLDIKRKEEQIIRAQLLGITEKLAQTRGELLIQKMILKSIIDDLTEEHPSRRLGKQEFFLRSSTTNDELIRKLKNNVSKLEIQQKEKIDEVLKVKRYKKGLEKLRVEAKTQFIQEQEKLEQKDSDEMTIMGFARKIMQRDKTNNFIG